MNIGASTTHPSKGPGLVVGVKAILGRKYVDVFFEKPKEKLTVQVEDLVLCRSPEEKITQGLFSDAGRFLLRLMLEQIRELNSAAGIHSAGNFKIIPLTHQLLAVNFVLDRFKPRALIADEVGLGKTIEAALIYQEMKARGIARRVLVIAPRASACSGGKR